MYFLEKKILRFFLGVILAIVVLIGILIFLTETKILSDLSYKTMKSNQEITLDVKPNIDHLEYYSTLIIDNPSGIKLQITTSDNKTFWENKTDKEYYDTKNKKKLILKEVDSKLTWEEKTIDNNDDIDFQDNNLVISFREEKTFSVTNNKYYTVTIKNISNRSGKVSASVYNY